MIPAFRPCGCRAGGHAGSGARRSCPRAPSRLGTRAYPAAPGRTAPRAAGRHGGGPGPGGAGWRGRARARGGRVRGGHGRVQRAGARALPTSALTLPYLLRPAGGSCGASEAVQLGCDRAHTCSSARTCPHAPARTCPHRPARAYLHAPAPPQVPAACEGQLQAGERHLGCLLSWQGPGAQVFSGSSPGAARFGHLRLRRSATPPRPASDASLSSMASM